MKRNCVVSSRVPVEHHSDRAKLKDVLIIFIGAHSTFTLAALHLSRPNFSLFPQSWPCRWLCFATSGHIGHRMRRHHCWIWFFGGKQIASHNHKMTCYSMRATHQPSSISSTEDVSFPACFARTRWSWWGSHRCQTVFWEKLVESWEEPQYLLTFCIFAQPFFEETGIFIKIE